MEMRCRAMDTTAIRGPGAGFTQVSRLLAGVARRSPARSVRALASPAPTASQIVRPAANRPIAREKPRSTREKPSITWNSKLGRPENLALLIGDDGAGAVTQAQHFSGLAQVGCPVVLRPGQP